MKKQFLPLVFALMASTFVVTSCSKDDGVPKEPESQLADMKAIVTYSGDLENGNVVVGLTGMVDSESGPLVGQLVDERDDEAYNTITFDNDAFLESPTFTVHSKEPVSGIMVVVLMNKTSDQSVNQTLRVQVFANGKVVDDRTIETDGNKDANYTVTAK